MTSINQVTCLSDLDINHSIRERGKHKSFYLYFFRDTKLLKECVDTHLNGDSLWTRSKFIPLSKRTQNDITGHENLPWKCINSALDVRQHFSKAYPYKTWQLGSQLHEPYLGKTCIITFNTGGFRGNGSVCAPVYSLSVQGLFKHSLGCTGASG